MQQSTNTITSAHREPSKARFYSIYISRIIRIDSIHLYIYIAAEFVCLFVCLFGIIL